MCMFGFRWSVNGVFLAYKIVHFHKKMVRHYGSWRGENSQVTEDEPFIQYLPLFFEKKRAEVREKTKGQTGREKKEEMRTNSHKEKQKQTAEKKTPQLDSNMNHSKLWIRAHFISSAWKHKACWETEDGGPTGYIHLHSSACSHPPSRLRCPRQTRLLLLRSHQCWEAVSSPFRENNSLFQLAAATFACYEELRQGRGSGQCITDHEL